MFTFALAFFAGHLYISLHFQPLSAFRQKRKKEFRRKHSQRKLLTTTTTCIRCRVSNWSLCLLCSMLLIFSERKCISKFWRKLINYKPENRIPWLFTDLDNIKDSPRLFKKIPWSFPDHEKFSFFPDLSLTVATLSDNSSCNTEDTDFVFNNQETKFVPYIKLIVRLFDAVTFGFSGITQNINLKARLPVSNIWNNCLLSNNRLPSNYRPF